MLLPCIVVAVAVVFVVVVAVVVVVVVGPLSSAFVPVLVSAFN